MHACDTYVYRYIKNYSEIVSLTFGLLFLWWNCPLGGKMARNEKMTTFSDSRRREPSERYFSNMDLKKITKTFFSLSQRFLYEKANNKTSESTPSIFDLLVRK